MRIIINLLLLVLIGALIYLLVHSINEPIRFRAEKDKREKAVADRLKEIRKAQEMYYGMYGKYAPSFDSLAMGLRTGQFAFIKVLGNPDDPTQTEFTYDTTYVPSIDSVQKLQINLDELSKVPFGDEDAAFSMETDTLTYQKTMTNVLEVAIRKKEFMGDYADPKYAMYDDSYDPNAIMKFGSLNAPNLVGNWE